MKNRESGYKFFGEDLLDFDKFFFFIDDGWVMQIGKQEMENVDYQYYIIVNVYICDRCMCVDEYKMDVDFFNLLMWM